MKKSQSKKGFTMAELVLVIAIIGFLFAIGGNTYRNQRNKFQFNDSLTKTIDIMHHNSANELSTVVIDSSGKSEELFGLVP